MPPQSWRESQGLSQAALAKRAGIGGVNPARTYARYETGESMAPAGIIAAIEKLSVGAVDANAFHRVRLAYLDRHPVNERAGEDA